MARSSPCTMWRQDGARQPAGGKPAAPYPNACTEKFPTTYVRVFPCPGPAENGKACPSLLGRSCVGLEHRHLWCAVYPGSMSQHELAAASCAPHFQNVHAMTFCVLPSSLQAQTPELPCASTAHTIHAHASPTVRCAMRRGLLADEGNSIWGGAR